METAGLNNDLKKFILTSCILAFLALRLPAQGAEGLEWAYFGPEQGMGMAFLDILQDHKGFIWLGSTNGLYRYDGYQITSFKKYSNRPTGLSSDWIWDLEEDEEGNLWIGTYDGGLNKWERSSGQFIHYYHNPEDSGTLRGNNVLKILVDNEGDLWLVVKNQDGIPVLDRLDPSSGEVTHFGFDPDHPNSLSCDTIAFHAHQSMQFTPLYLDPKGNVWVATKNGLNLYVQGAGGFRRFMHEDGNSNSLRFNNILAIEASKEKEGIYWVRSASYGLGEVALDRLDLNNGNMERVSFGGAGQLGSNCLGFHVSEDRIWISDHSLRPFQRSPLQPEKQIELKGMQPGLRVGLFRHSSGNFFLPFLGINPINNIRGGDNLESPQGIFFFDSKSNLPHFITRNPTNPGLPFYEVLSIMEDRSGMVWIGNGVGFYKLKITSEDNSNKPVFENYYLGESEKGGLSSTAIRDIYEESADVFWLATYQGGLNRLDRRAGKVTHFTQDSSRPNSIGSNLTYSLWHDPKSNELWIGHHNGIDILNLDQVAPDEPSTAVFRHLSHPSGLFDGQVNEIEPDGKGRLWIGTGSNGLILFDPGTAKIIQQLIFDEHNSDPAHSAFINKVYKDLQGQTWVAPGMGGLCRLKEVAGIFQSDCFLDGIFIVDFFEASDGLLWCAAMNYGIVKFNPNDETYELVNMENRLSRNSVLGIEQDKLGRIWFTSSGLTRYDPEEDTYRTYGQEAGIIGMDPGRCFFKSKSGELFYSSYYSALQIFTPEKVVDNPIAPKAVLTDFKLFNERVLAGEDSPLKENIEVASEIRLAYDQHSFSFVFTGLEFTNPSENQYRYQLVGIDKSWVFSGTHREARYNSVPPGKYTFQVEAANSDGTWSEEPAIVRVIISPPWWSRWWAYILFTALFFALLMLIYRYQVKRRAALEEAKRLKEIDLLKTRLYTNITHEFRTPLTVILGMAGQVVQKPERWFREGMEMITRNGQNLLTLVNQMLDLRKIESGVMQVDMQLGDVVTYLKYVTESFHSFAESKQISLHFFSTMPELRMDFDEDKLLKILSNLLSNAIKYTPGGGTIYVLIGTKIEEGQEFVEARVKDTGIGIPADKQARIFDRFYQVDDTATRKGEGLGVGLALTQELVKLLNGTISVQSEPGKGSEFLVQLPVTRTATVHKPFQKEKVDQVAGQFKVGDSEGSNEALLLDGDGNGKPLALVIEDNKDVVRYLQACLEQDYSVLAANSGKTGIEMAIDQVPDIIISDVMMPEKDGFEVTATLKNDERTSHIPIILLTARTATEDRITGLERGADAYLGKPFNREELMVRMEKMIQLRKRLQERYASLNPEPEPSNPSWDMEDAFVQKVREVVEAHLDDPDFSVEALSGEVFLSRTQVHRKLKALTGQSTGHFIHSVRLHHALHLLQTTGLSVTEIAFDVGFKDPSYFSKVFTAEFGKAPSESRG
ncbi:MAG: response regulator [Lewinellaceae bacterium]|nr:response regulator [Phaeodactylibacter sp.]MCB0613540.1 response regulator [Phaeodactylibacter sp.]MCB9351587.1 response regulator [Lewinellaceae bacterium]